MVLGAVRLVVSAARELGVGCVARRFTLAPSVVVTRVTGAVWPAGESRRPAADWPSAYTRRRRLVSFP